MKICTKCKEIKPLDQFSKNCRTKSGLEFHCKPCVSIRTSSWSKNNKERRNAITRNWAENNEDYFIEYRKTHKEQKRLYKNNRLKTNINFKLSHTLRRRLNLAIKRGQKAGSPIEDLGCTIEQLKLHLESKFLPGMTWNNWGQYGWHIDHILPLSSFNLSNIDDFKKAVHYINLQPLWAKDNLSKSDKI